MKRLFLLRTRHDIGNQYLYVYSEEIVVVAQDHYWVINKIEDKNSNKKELFSRVKKNRPNLIIFNGHGENDYICGYANECLIDINSASILDKTVVFSRSCSALNELGKESVSKGCIAFIGYNDEFQIPRVNEFEATPLRDPTTKPVMEVSNLVAKQLLKGASVKEAVTAAKKKASELILKMLTSKEPYDAAAFKALFNNHLSLDFEGDSEAVC